MTKHKQQIMDCKKEINKILEKYNCYLDGESWYDCGVKIRHNDYDLEVNIENDNIDYK